MVYQSYSSSQKPPSAAASSHVHYESDEERASNSKNPSRFRVSSLKGKSLRPSIKFKSRIPIHPEAAPHSVRRGDFVLIHKLDNQEICKSRTDRAREIFKYLKASRNSKKRSGRRQVKHHRISSGCKAFNIDTITGRDEDSPAPKELKGLSLEEKRIRYGRSLIRKRKNKQKWVYDPALELDCNVERFGQEEYDDEDEDGVSCVRDILCEDEFDDDGYRTYCPFDDSGRREYTIYLKKRGPFEVKFLRELYQRALECSEDVAIHALGLYGPSGKADCLMVALTEEEADRFAGLEDVWCVTPCWGWDSSGRNRFGSPR